MAVPSFAFTFRNSNSVFLSTFSLSFFFLHLSSFAIMSTGVNPSTKKRKYKPWDPPGPDRAEINWKEEEFHNLVRDMGFHSEWGAQLPTPNSTALDAPPGYITLYAAYFWEGNFRLPMSKFTAEVLTNYGLPISQINALGLPQLTHFKFICKANRIEPTFEMFNVFYFVSYTRSFYSFNSWTSGVSPCSTNPPKSLHEWKQKFFYFRCGVIPVDMHYRAESESVPHINVSVDFAGQEWKATPISQLEERALVGACMSMLWVPNNPRGIPVYGYQGKRISVAHLCFWGYSLLYVLDPKAAGAMVEAILPEGKPVWLDQISDHFLHHTSESFASYANTILGEDGENDLDDSTDPVREEIIILSSGGSDGSHEGLIPRSTRAGPAQGTWNEPKLDKSEKKEKKVEENVAEIPRKQPSNHLSLDYVVVSNTLSSLDAGEKRTERDPDHDVTLTEIMNKKKFLEDTKKELDEQAAAALAAKKSKLQKETPPAPSESEIDMGVFSAKRGNLLEKIFVASGSQGTKTFVCLPCYLSSVFTFDYHGCFVTGVKSGKAPRKVNISKITPPTSPPSRTFGLSPPHVDRGKRKEDDVEVDQVGEGGGDARGVGDAGAGGDDVQEESRVLLSVSPPAERLFQKRRNWLDLLDDHIQAGVNFFATSQEIAREWQLMGEETLAFENAKTTFAEEREREKPKISDEAEQERVAHQKKEEEYIQRIAKLEKFAEEKIVESKASEILVEEVTTDCKWLLARAVPLIAKRIAGSEELAKYMYELGETAYAHGRKEGYAEGRATSEAKEPLKSFDLHKTDCVARYAEKRQEFESLEFAIVKAAGKLSRKPDGIALLKRALGDEDHEVGGVGASRQE
ncbi:hypothetical protein Hanom_Chr04g00288291 [Helianthus anomalus]